MSVKSKHSSKKSSSGKKERNKKLEDTDEDIESSEEELDLTKECHPIGYYLNDRAEMINQMFSVIKGNKLKAMLPPILKDYDIEQLKLQCLDQLLGMSDKRITSILEGESLETSSESEVSESDECDENDTDEKNGTTSGSNSERSDDSQGELQSSSARKEHKKRKTDVSKEAKSRKLAKHDSGPVEQGKTLLEILELEMRAKAIRALLKQSNNDKGSDNGPIEPKSDVNDSKGLSNEVVDLTECEDDEFTSNTKKETSGEEDIDKKVLNFEEKIEKSKSEKPSQIENEKSKKFQAELEIRNKLFKKKIYRTRQQRMESEEDEKIGEKSENCESHSWKSGEAVIKQVKAEPVEVVLEDPEEGEVSTSEDESSTKIKQEPKEPEETTENNIEAKKDEVEEKGRVAKPGTFEFRDNLENLGENKEVKENQSENLGENLLGESINEVPEVVKDDEPLEGLQTPFGESSWRDRWLRNDGVQKLVKSSKIYAKVKKRIAEKSLKAKEEGLMPYDINSDSNSSSRQEMIEGSIGEYERLLGKNEQSEVGESVEKMSGNGESEKT